MRFAKLPATEQKSISHYFSSQYDHLENDYHEQTRSLWFYMQGQPRPCFTWELLSDLHQLFNKIDTYIEAPHPVEYVIAASGVQGVYNLGGDLANFLDYIRTGNAERLRTYAYKCLELGFKCHQQFNRGITSIALVEGSCYGGGFEAALSCNVLIVEESANFCFPEVSFNLFPGMGAYSYLARRVAPHVADKMITSGRMYSGREIYEMGIADICAPNGMGHEVTLDYINQHRRQQRARIAMQKAKSVINPVSMSELKQISDIWVDSAIQLDERSLKIMERFSRAQTGKNFPRREIERIKLPA